MALARKTKLYVAGIMAALIFVGLAVAYFFQSNDHLMPDGNENTWGVPLPTRIVDAFRPDLGSGVQVSVVVNPELAIKKFVTGIRGSAGNYAIFAAELDNSTNEVRRCELPIASKLDGKIVHVWQQMLGGVRSYPEPMLGLDGTDYYFSAQVGDQRLTGRTWSPQTPKMKRLTSIASTMKVLCQSGDRGGLEGLQHQVDDLLIRH